MYERTRDSQVLIGGIVALTIGAAALLVWLGSVMLEQDRTERLEHAADRAVQVFERQISTAEADLAMLVASPTEPAKILDKLSPEVLDQGLIVLLESGTVQVFPQSGLLFHPDPPVRSEPEPDLFREGEAVEYRDPRRAAAVYRRLAASSDETVRAGALMRLGRALRRADDLDPALETYADMAALGDVPVIGLPSELVARDARVDVLEEMGRSDDAKREAQALVNDLTKGHWILTQAQYELYAERAAEVAGAAELPVGRFALAQAVSSLWNQWQRDPVASGRRLMQAGGVHLLGVTHGTPERMGVWLVRPDDLARRLTEELGIAVTLSDAGGVIVGDEMTEGHRAVRTPAETRLPWTVHADQVLPAASAGRFTSAQLVVAGLGVMLIFLVAGTYVIGRAVKREVDLSRQQADFVSAVSHEFRTPLAAMRQLSELLADGRVHQPDKRQHYYESLAGESRRLQRLVENLLDFGRLEAGARPFHIEPLDPRALVEQVVAEFRAQPAASGPRIDVEGDETAGRMMADQDALALALHNLIDNAVKYSGGDKPVRVRWNREHAHVALSVRDEGPGLAADERKRVFSKFVRGSAAASANARGSGVGLAIVDQVVSGLGGEVRVESAPGAGATFTLLLPAAEAP